MRLIDGDALKEAFYQKMMELLKSTNMPQISNEALSLLCGASLIIDAPTVEAVPWEKLERYADYFCACVPYTEFVREAKQFYLDVPEKNVGKWIFGFDEETGERDLKAWTCSLCGEKYPWQPNFCPHCGARMNGKETENDKSGMDK